MLRFLSNLNIDNFLFFSNLKHIQSTFSNSTSYFYHLKFKTSTHQNDQQKINHDQNTIFAVILGPCNG